jgi:transposase
VLVTRTEELAVQMTLGIDVACRAAHQASLADETGRFAWSGRRFRTAVADLEQLWLAIPAGAAVTVVMEPTRNAWVPLAAWFRRRGATVIMVPPEQSADLRDYYSKHAKSDRLDSRMLARLPLLHPDGLRPAEGLGPAEALRRATRLRSSLVKRRNVIIARLDSYLELLGPAWHAAFGGDLALFTPLRFLAAGYADPHAVRRLGHARLTRFIWRYSHGAWSHAHATALLAAATETLQLWDGELSYPDLAEDIAAEARLALSLSAEICDLDVKLAALLHQADPDAILTSVPGVGIITGAQILARLGDPARFQSLAGARSFSGLVPSLTASGASGHHGPPTKKGDAPLREALFMAANQARRTDPTLAARYHRLMVCQGKHHNSALCHISTTLLTRIIACWRAGTAYQIRDLDGTPLTTAQGRAITAQRYRVSDELRAQRRTSHTKQGRAGDTRSRHALRHQPAPAPRYDHQPKPLTPLKNSTGRCLPGGSSGPARRWCCLSGSAGRTASPIGSPGPPRRPPRGRSSGCTSRCSSSCSMTTAHSPAWRCCRRRWMPGARTTTPTGRTSPWTWPSLSPGSPPRARRWRCTRPLGTAWLVPVLPAPGRPANPQSQPSARPAAGRAGGGPGGPAVGEPADRRAAGLARPRARWPGDHLVDRRDHPARPAGGHPAEDPAIPARPRRRGPPDRPWRPARRGRPRCRRAPAA